MAIYGKTIRWLRHFTNETANREPKWRHARETLSTGYHPTTYSPSTNGRTRS